MNSSDENDDVGLDLTLSIGPTFRNLPAKSKGTGSGGSDSSSSTSVSDGDEKSGVTVGGEIRRGEGKRKRKNREEEEEGNRGLKKKVDPTPTVQMAYPYSYMPFLNNAYGFPCAVPYWAGGAAFVGHAGERTLHQPVASRSFRPFDNGCQLEQDNNGKSSSSSSSPVCSSSVISDHYQTSSSLEGSISCNSSSDKEEHQICCPKAPKPGIPSTKSILNGKPPKPVNNVPMLQHMPCVSTTGVGSNGKTITGFLYRYSKLEVSILCVCHGQFFSPAEFVKHAGGGEVSHPLRHITLQLPNSTMPSSTIT